MLLIIILCILDVNNAVTETNIRLDSVETDVQGISIT